MGAILLFCLENRFARFLGHIADSVIERNNDRVEDQFLSRAMTLGDLDRMDVDGSGDVSPDEFLRYMLVALQKVEKEDIDGKKLQLN